MEHDDIEVVGLEAVQRALDRGAEELGRPRLAGQFIFRVAGFRNEDNIVAVALECLAQARFGAHVHRGGVEEVDAAVEQEVDELAGLLGRRFEEPDRRGAEAEAGDVEVGLSEERALHSPLF